MAAEIADPFWIEVIELNQRLNRDIIEIVLAELASADEDEEDGLMDIDEEVILAEPLGHENVPSLSELSTSACNNHLSSGDLSVSNFQAKLRAGKVPTEIVFSLLVNGKDNATRTNKNFSCYAKDIFFDKRQLNLLLSRQFRLQLHTVFQELLNQHFIRPTLEIPLKLQNEFTQATLRFDELVTSYYLMQGDAYSEIVDIKFLFKLAEFLTEAGWFAQAFRLYQLLYKKCLQLSKTTTPENKVSYYKHKIFFTNGAFHANTQCVYCSVLNGNLDMAHKFLGENDVGQSGITSDKIAEFYAVQSLSAYAIGDYKNALDHGIKGFYQVRKGCSKKTLIEVLRCLSRALAVTRHFNKAIMFSAYCLDIASQIDYKMADGFAAHAYCLMQADKNIQASLLYRTVLKLREKQFGYDNNLHVAMANEEMSYACYVLNYQTGKFLEAKRFVQRSRTILEKLLPSGHLLISSSKRVEALIIEEIALEKYSGDNQLADKNRLLEEAHQLQKQSLNTAISTFGEESLQTAKHYGNLGRLFQSMDKYKEAEKLHLKAIKIKESLLGDEDSEVAVSLGHLASLYNYDMNLFNEAEALYKRCIKICLKHFGRTYSGLEYDYRGLIRVYRQLDNMELRTEYENLLFDWQIERENASRREGPILTVSPNTISFESLQDLLEDIINDK